MRKEVKLGFAIGGVVLAVVLVWVLSLGGSGNKTMVASATDGKADASSITPSDGSLNDEKPQIAQAQAPGVAAQPTTAPAPQTATADARKTGGELDWGKLLNGSQQIPLMTQTPAPVPAKPLAPVASSAIDPASAAAAPAADTNAEAASTGAGSEMVPSAAATGIQEAPAPAQLSADTTSVTPTAGPRSHQIQRGETLSSIAMAAYGSPNFYPAILRANPNLNPRKMKPGMTIVLPDVSEVKHDAAATSDPQSAAPEAHAASATIDASHQYKVQPGDSLYRISMKLYGNSRMQEKIYELNRTTIGASKERIRVGMVLNLPSAPTAAAGAR